MHLEGNRCRLFSAWVNHLTALLGFNLLGIGQCRPSQNAKKWLDSDFAKCEDFCVRIISRRKIREAVAEHGEWAAPLNSWYKIAKAADWDNFASVKGTWSTADKVGACVVFDVSHNKCRVIAWINYKGKKVFIRYVLSHAEYNKDRWKDDCDCD